jgi:hypothetical protein
MTVRDLAEAFPWLKDSDMVFIALPKAELGRALEMAGGGPEMLSTTKAAERWGFTARRWREWAKDGLVPGASREERADESGTISLGDWNLPRESCRAIVDEIRLTGCYPMKDTAPPRAKTPAVAVNGSPLTQISERRFGRGPRKPSDR